RRTFRRRLLRRAICPAGRGGHVTRDASPAGRGRVALAFRRRPAQPGGNPYPGAEASGIDGQPLALPGRPPHCVACRRRRAVSRDPRCGERMGGPQGIAAVRGADVVYCFRYGTALPRRHRLPCPSPSGTTVVSLARPLPACPVDTTAGSTASLR